MTPCRCRSTLCQFLVWSSRNNVNYQKHLTSFTTSFLSTFPPLESPVSTFRFWFRSSSKTWPASQSFSRFSGLCSPDRSTWLPRQRVDQEDPQEQHWISAMMQGQIRSLSILQWRYLLEELTHLENAHAPNFQVLQLQCSRKCQQQLVLIAAWFIFILGLALRADDNELPAGV